ncbi:MAG: hypothetical protein IJC73_03740 [Lentisphaeria bacterium]|nr:hypothetical protein [Lentisphaeria bacterium]
MAVRCRQNFTMIEMVLVLLIVAVVMSIAAAFFVSASRDDSLDGHVEKLSEMLQSCRVAALRTGREQHLYYRSTTRYWEWPEKEKTIAVPNDIMVMSPVTGSDAEAGDNELCFIFYPGGGARPVTVTLRSREDERHLRCLALTGTVAVFDPEAEVVPLWEEKKW